MVLALAGCSGNNRVVGDPLLGKSAALPSKPSAAAQANAGPNPGAAAQVPAIPVPTSSASTAALAVASAALPEDRNNLQIGGSAPSTGTKSWTRQTTESGTTATRPEPAFEAVRQARPGSPSSSVLGGTRVTSYEQGQAQLRARGVSWQRLESLGDQGGWKFTCSIAKPGNKFLSTTYEAEAPTDLAAMQAVLDQIDKER
jgi:hypothetical protein